jgi:hypothetical protein
MRRFKIAWVVPLLALASSCSWVAVKPPPERRPSHDPVECTESNAAPMADTVGVVIFGAAAVGCGIGAGALAAEPAPKGQENWGGTVALLLGLTCVLPAAVLAIPYAVSSHHGFKHTTRCRQLKELEGRQGMPCRTKADAACAEGLACYHDVCLPAESVRRHRTRRDPEAGSRGRLCRAPPAPPCDAELACVLGRCVFRPPTSAPMSRPAVAAPPAEEP